MEILKKTKKRISDTAGPKWHIMSISDKDWMVATPIANYRKYGVFPYEVVVEIIYLALLIACVVAVAQHGSVEFRNTQKTFEGIILHPDVTAPIVRTDDFKKHFGFAVASFYNIDQDSLEKFFSPPSNETIPVLVTYMNGTRQDFRISRDRPLGPFQNMSNPEISTFLLDYTRILIAMNFTGPKYGFDHLQHWVVTLEYHMDFGDVYWEVEVDQIDYLQRTDHWGYRVAICLVIISFITIVYNFAIVVKTLFVYFRTRKRFDQIPVKTLKKLFLDLGVIPPPKKWNDVPLTVLISFFSPWELYSIVGSLLIMTSNVISLAQARIPSTDMERLLFGVGLLISVSNMTKYFNYFPLMYTLVITLTYSMQKLTLYLISVFPIFLSFVLASNIIFAPYSDNFDTYVDSSLTLYSLLNGDEMHGIFADVTRSYPYTGFAQFYLFFYSYFFIFVILTIIIFIIEDAYHLAKVVSARMMYSERGIPAAELEMYESEYKAAMADLDLEKLFMVLDGYEEEMGNFDKKYELHHMATINGEKSDDCDSTKSLLNASDSQGSLAITLDSSIGHLATVADNTAGTPSTPARAIGNNGLSSSADQHSPSTSLILSDEKSVATQLPGENEGGVKSTTATTTQQSSSPHREKREPSGQPQGVHSPREESPMLKRTASLRKGYEKTLHHIAKRNVPSQSFSPQQTKDLHLHADDTVATSTTSGHSTASATSSATALALIEDFSLLRDKLVERLYHLPRSQLAVLQELGGAWEDIQKKHDKGDEKHQEKQEPIFSTTASTTSTTTLL